MPEVSIVIVGYNSLAFLQTCIPTIYRQSFIDFEVILVDNNSQDETVKFVRNYYPQIKLIENKTNVGFAKANNQAIKVSTGTYILTLNPDVELEDNFLHKLVNFFENSEANRRFGMLCSKMLRKDRKTIDSTGLILTRLRRFFDRGSGQIDNGKFNKPAEVFGCCAAAALYKRDMLEDIRVAEEYFDEDFFLFVDDVDLAWRSQNRGWNAYYVPDAICYHQRYSCGYDRQLTQYYSLRNRYFMIIKNEQRIWSYVPIFFIYDIPRFIYMLFTNFKNIHVIPDFIKLTKLMLEKKRKAIQMKRVTPWISLRNSIC